MAWLGVGLAALLMVDLATSDTDAGRLVPGAALLCAVGGVYVLWLRPRVVATEHGVRLVNPMRETFVPWSAFTWADVTDVVRVHAGDRVFRSWPLRETSRRKVRDNLRRAGGHVDPTPEEDPRTMRPMDAAAKRLREEAERRRAALGDGTEAGRPDERPREGTGFPGAPVTRWSPDSVAALAGPLVLLLAAALLG
ncbi:PH domain-containing protein [Halostreptopolyspora alba]